MALALIVLALGSVAAGFVGIPHALGGHNALHAWLDPAFHAPSGEALARALAEGEPVAEGGAEAAMELTLMGVSVAIGVVGVSLGIFIWGRRRDIADAMARQFGALHALLLNKYYVDEIYDAAIVQPIRVASQEGLWRGFDVKIIDGAVNGAGTIVNSSATLLRRLQTGSVKTYAGSVFVGAVAILAYYLWL